MSYVLAKSKDSAIHEAGECGGAVTSIFKYLLDEGIVDGVLALSPQDDVYVYDLNRDKINQLVTIRHMKSDLPAHNFMDDIDINKNIDGGEESTDDCAF